MNAVSVTLALCFSAWSASAQSLDSLEAIVTLDTDPQGAHVFIDSVFVGQSPILGLRLAAGRHVLRAVYPSVAEWRALNVYDSLELRAGDTVGKVYPMGTFVQIETVPPGAIVIVRDSALGVTPFVYRSSSTAPVELSLRAQGYNDSTVTIVRPEGPIRIVLGEAAKQAAGTATAGDFLGTGETSGRAWASYAAAASVIGLGIASAYFNLEANENYDLYLSTAEQRYLDATHRYDRAALWSLALTQVSFGVLVYLLLSE